MNRASAERKSSSFIFAFNVRIALTSPRTRKETAERFESRMRLHNFLTEIAGKSTEGKAGLGVRGFGFVLHLEPLLANLRAMHVANGLL